MKNLFFPLLISIACLFSACDNKITEEETPLPVKTKEIFSGYVQKGPYVNGSSVMITLLDEQLNQTGSVFTTQIIDNSGNFEQKNLKYASDFVELKADGYYFNEVKGENSNGSLTLYALADIKDVNSVNINILTHLERPRIIFLIQNKGLSFAEAKKQAKNEVLDIFKLTLPDDIASESLNVTKDALLLAVSVIVQGQLSTGDMSELLANISADIRTDGKLDNSLLGNQLMNNVAFIDFEKVKSSIEKRYSGLGIEMTVNIDELKSLIEQFKSNSGFIQTLSITYPKTGKYGPNILADDFVEGTYMENGIPKEYSIRAELPVGNSSLKVILKTKNPYNNYWGSYHLNSVENWWVSSWDHNLKCNTWTVYENGKSSDATIKLEFDCIIEYYENGATTPTKVKTVKIDRGDTATDDEHEREMLIAFYKSTNGDNWRKKDNWCSDRPISEWYGIETWYHNASGKSRVKSIFLPNNNLTGSAYITDLKSIWDIYILNGNKIESLTIDNCGKDFPDGSNYGELNTIFYHLDYYEVCNLKSLNISNSDGCVYISGNFSAETVTISNCKLASSEYMQFSLPTTNIGTITVSDCTMGSFSTTDNSLIGNITIENCTFLRNSKLDNAYIHVENKTKVNNCKGLRYIYSKLCSDLTVTNTECNDIRCGN